MKLRTLIAAGAAAASVAPVSLSALPASGAPTANTQVASCTDGGGARWTVRSVWAGVRTATRGSEVVTNAGTGFTTSAKAATTVDYSIRTYDGSGRLVQVVGAHNVAFRFGRSAHYLTHKPKDLPSVAGRAKIVVSVGDGNDGRGNCRVTFVQPAAETPTKPGNNASVPRGDLPGWKQVFLDDFDANAPLGSWTRTYGNRWRAYPEPWKDTSRHGTYAPNRVLSVQNGVLDMYLHSEGRRSYVAAPEPKINGTGRRGQVYGRYSVRFRVPNPIPGYKTAWLLWPDSNRNAEGEIDFPEGDLSRGSTIGAYAHDVNGRHSHNAFFADTRTTYDAWHTATFEWLPSGVTYWLDGRLLGTTPRLGTPHTAMHWVLQTETELGSRVPSPSVSGHVEVDWVAVWKRG